MSNSTSLQPPLKKLGTAPFTVLPGSGHAAKEPCDRWHLRPASRFASQWSYTPATSPAPDGRKAHKNSHDTMKNGQMRP